MPPTRPQHQIPQSSPYERPTSTDNYPCADPSPRRQPRSMRHETYPVRMSPLGAPTFRPTTSPPRSRQPSSSKPKPNPFLPTQKTLHSPPGHSFLFHQFNNSLGINTEHSTHVTERKNYISTPLEYALKSTSSTSTIGQLENEYVEEGG